MPTFSDVTVASLRLTRQITTNPLLSGALLAFLTYAPSEQKDKFLALPYIQKIGPDTLRRVLQLLLGLGALRLTNKWLNSLATNNWCLSAPSASKWVWEKEIAVITGGCGGIGTAIAQGLTAKGVRVALLDIIPMPEVLASNPRVSYYRCDITSPTSVAEVAEKIRAELGNPSILINNAGMAYYTDVLDTKPEMVNRIFGVNIISHWWTVQQFLPFMLEQNKGHIVTLASLASFVALPGASGYSATKSAVLAFHEALASEIKHHYKKIGVMTTVVHPNFVKTPLTDPWKGMIERGTGTMLTVDDIAGPVLKQIFGGRGGQLVMPREMGILAGLRGWPNWMQEMLRDGFGRAK